MRYSRRALEITAMIRSSRATRPAAAPVCGSRLHPHSRIRRLRSSSSSRRSGMTTPRASVPMLRQRSTAGPTRSTTTRSRTSVGPPRRAEPPSSLRLHCSGRHRQARCGAPTFAAWPSSMDLLTAARFEAIGIAAVTNALIAAWDAKYTYMFWRPVTAIRAGDTDGNSETEPDPAWTPFIVTPSHPEYPAAHTHGRRERAGVLHGVVRHRSVPAGVQGQWRRGSLLHQRQ